MLYSNNRIEDESALAFSWKRIKKLYPLHIEMLLLAMLPIALHWIDRSVKFTYADMLKVLSNALLIQSWIPDSKFYFSFNAVSWYLSTLAAIYFFAPKVIKVFRNINNGKKEVVILAAIVSTQCLISFFADRMVINGDGSGNTFCKWVSYIFPLYRMGDFIAGICIANLFVRFDKDNDKIKSTILEISVIALNLLIIGLYQSDIEFIGKSWSQYSVGFLIAAAFFVLIFSGAHGWLTVILTNRMTVWIGNITGYAFLIHQLVIKYFKLILERISMDIINNLCTGIACYIITVALSCLYKRLHERNEVKG